MEWYPLLTVNFSGYSKVAGKVSKKHVLKISIHIYCVTCYICFSQLSLPVLLYFLHFSVFLLLLEYVKLDNSFSYPVLVEVCMFLIVFIFIILSMFVCIMYFCRIYRKIKRKEKITWFITFAFTRILNKSFITSSFVTIVNQFFTFTSAFIIIPMLFIIINTCI